MANPEHLAILKKGVEAWNQWRRKQSSIGVAPAGPGVYPLDLSDANLEDAKLVKYEKQSGLLDQTEYVNTTIIEVDLHCVNLRGANLRRANLCEANLVKADLRASNLRGVDLSGADLNGADLSGANISRSYLCGAKFIGANLSGADLHRANLKSTKLGEANLSKASLTEAQLHSADLSKANLAGADLRGANLEDSALKSADLRCATLVGANFTGAVLDLVDLTEAIAGATTFGQVDLSGVIGLDTVKHLGPSSIGIDTIYKSKGKIPHIFLRGCGVPENFIEYMASLVGTGVEFYSLFISYSTQDQEFAERLHADLQTKGVRCWFAPHDLKGGKKVYRQIDEAIRVYDRLLLILSEASMSSEWVRTEIAIARKREVEQRRDVLFPIGLCPFKTIRKWEYFDSDIGKDSAREIREYVIPDFSNWKDHDLYKLAFDRLIHDLQGAAQAPRP